MKAFRLLLIIALVAVALGAFQGAAKAAGAFSYTSGFQVQNLEAATATVTITFYNQDGTVANTVTDTIPASGDKKYFPLTQVTDTFNGSVVISSDKQVAAVSNVLGNNGAAAASYVGSTSGNTTLLLPLLMKGNAGFNTWFNVQNTSSSADATVTVTYSDGITASGTIKPGASKTFYQSDEAHTAKVFSAVVTSTQPVAATVIEESTKVMFAYSGFTAGSKNPVMPLINANNVGYQTGVQIQNAGSAATTVTVSYTPASAGTACTETQTIQPGQSNTFALAAFANGSNSTCAPLAKFIGSAQVTANSGAQDLVAIVNQLKGSINGEAYGAFNPASATAKVVFPLIMDRNGGYFTGFNVMNVGAAATTVTCTFTNTSYQATATLAPGQALNDLQGNKIANAYVGSGTCNAPGGQIVGVVNELGPNQTTADQLLVYEGISAP